MKAACSSEMFLSTNPLGVTTQKTNIGSLELFKFYGSSPSKQVPFVFSVDAIGLTAVSLIGALEVLQKMLPHESHF
jgi:hypothetical protein